MSRARNPQLSIRAQNAVRQIYQCQTYEQLDKITRKCQPLIEELEDYEPPHEVRIILKGITNALKWRKEQLK